MRRQLVRVKVRMSLTRKVSMPVCGHAEKLFPDDQQLLMSPLDAKSRPQSIDTDSMSARGQPW